MGRNKSGLLRSPRTLRDSQFRGESRPANNLLPLLLVRWSCMLPTSGQPPRLPPRLDRRLPLMASVPAAPCIEFACTSSFPLPTLTSLFDHLVGAGEQRGRHVDAKRQVFSACCANHLTFIATGEKAHMSRLATIFAVVAWYMIGTDFNIGRLLPSQMV